jgi:hypothetical protein
MTGERARGRSFVLELVGCKGQRGGLWHFVLIDHVGWMVCVGVAWDVQNLVHVYSSPNNKTFMSIVVYLKTNKIISQTENSCANNILTVY